MSKDILMPLRKFHGWLHEYPIYRTKRKEMLTTYVPMIRDKLRQKPRSVFLVMTPEHGNLGDHAIAFSEIKMLKDSGIDYIEITDRHLNELNRANLLNIMNGYPIIINGGGNMGTLWFDAECTHRSVISNNPKSPVFIFPNTIYYEDSEWGKKEFKKSISIYNNHKKLFVYAREKNSFVIMNDVYKNVKLIPDIVFSLNESYRKTERYGCLLCLRKDCEKTITEIEEQEIRNAAKILFGDDVLDTDMVVSGGVPAYKREMELHEKFDEFSKAGLVITDRLHGMIFCAITGTPCIVINSKSPKVRGCYEWIKHLDYVRFVDDVTNIVEEYCKIPHQKHSYVNYEMCQFFDKIKDDVIQQLYGGVLH